MRGRRQPLWGAGVHSSMPVTLRPDECRIRTAFCLPYPIPFTLIVTVVKPRVRAYSAAQQMDEHGHKMKPTSLVLMHIHLGIAPSTSAHGVTISSGIGKLGNFSLLLHSSQPTGCFHRAERGNMATDDKRWMARLSGSRFCLKYGFSVLREPSRPCGRPQLRRRGW